MKSIKVINENNGSGLYYADNPSLSLKAKGIMSTLLTTDYCSKRELLPICKEGSTAIQNGINELKDNHYLIIEKLMPEKGNNQLRYIYHISENANSPS